MKSVLYIIMFSFSITLVWGQQTVINQRQGHASAVLDVSQTTGQGLVPPKVVLTSDLASVTNPVANPVEGLIVYNTGTNHLKGYYIWNNGMWSLLGTKENSISNMILRQNAGTNAITFSANNFQTLNFINNVFVNTIPDVTHSNGQFTVPAGSYVLQLVMNVNTAETTTGSIGSRVNAHFYQGRLYTAANTVLVGPMDVNESSISTSTAAKSHMISINFSFKVEQTTTFSLQLARRAGGTYSGGITVQDSFVHLERSIL